MLITLTVYTKYEGKTVEIQYVLDFADTNKEIQKVVRKTHTKRIKVSLLKDEKIRKLFDEKVIVLAIDGATNLRVHFKDGV